MQEGIVTKAYGGFYYVRVEEDLLECRLRGKFRKQKQNALPGDRVRVAVLEQGKGVVEEILPRKNELVRPPIVNIEQVLLVFASHEPEPDFTLLDRLLVLAATQGLEQHICFNKADLLTAAERQAITERYQGTGYTVAFTSALGGVGLEQIRALLKDSITVIAGPSGAGKSTLLNSLEPGLSLKTGAVSEKIGRGRHTTRHVELLELSFGGLVADTPGFSSLFLPAMEKNTLTDYFPDFAPYLRECRFGGCQHDREPDCAVKQALATGEINQERYQNYLTFLAEVKAQERRY